MELAVLQRIALELNELLRGGFISKVHQPLPRDIVLRVRVPHGGERKLMMSADPQLGRIHLTDLKIPNPPSPPRFCAFLRAHLQGGIVTQVTCAPDDRVVRIATVRGPREDPVERDLVLELLGRDSNFLVVERPSGIIMECLHRIPEKETATRIVFPGNAYHAPPKRQAGDGQPEYVGEPPPLSPGIISGPGGRKRLTLRADPEGDELYTSMNLAADALFSARLRALLLEAARREVLRPLKASINSLDRRAEKVRADIARLARYAGRQEEGELLKANLARIKRGLKEVEVLDWSTGRPRTVILDPALDGVGNMQRIFKAAAKGKRGERIAAERLARTLEEKRGLEDMVYFVEEARDAEELDRLALEMPALRSMAKSRKGSVKDKKVGCGLPSFRRFVTPSGLVALVGKSGRGNDNLLREKAREGDLWFHVKGMAGAHVVLLQREHGPASHADQEFAAALAVRFSKARDKGKVEVIVADVKHVTRFRGALPGQVTVKSYTTMLSEALEIKPQE